MSEPEQKVAIVTGAGSGVGRDTALLLADAGYAVVLAARTEADLHATVAYLKEEAAGEATTLVVPTDVSDSGACAALVQQTLEKFGRIDALANCAARRRCNPSRR